LGKRAKLTGMRLTKAAALDEAKAHETLTNFTFPSNHWRQIGCVNDVSHFRWR